MSSPTIEVTRESFYKHQHDMEKLKDAAVTAEAKIQTEQVKTAELEKKVAEQDERLQQYRASDRYMSDQAAISRLKVQAEKPIEIRLHEEALEFNAFWNIGDIINAVGNADTFDAAYQLNINKLETITKLATAGLIIVNGSLSPDQPEPDALDPEDLDTDVELVFSDGTSITHHAYEDTEDQGPDPDYPHPLSESIRVVADEIANTAKTMVLEPTMSVYAFNPLPVEVDGYLFLISITATAHPLLRHAAEDTDDVPEIPTEG